MTPTELQQHIRKILRRESEESLATALVKSDSPGGFVAVVR